MPNGRPMASRYAIINSRPKAKHLTNQIRKRSRLKINERLTQKASKRKTNPQG